MSRTPPSTINRAVPARIGVLLVNLGTPDAPDTPAVKRYLREFLSDRRVVEIPAIAWQPILRGIILNTRPAKSAKAYREVWTETGSPLASITRAQAEALANAFGSDVIVDWAMRYGNPSIESRLNALFAVGCDRILIASLYPQYCGATTATVNDEVFRVIKSMRHQPALRTLPPWHDRPSYIAALAGSTEAAIARLPFVPDMIVASFHGMPERTRSLGDPYYDQCIETGRLLGEALDRPLTVTFQSRFGPAKWLEPATDTTLAALPGQGITRVAVMCPGFVADCLETLEEIALRGRDSFLEAGGKAFGYMECMNDTQFGVNLLHELISEQLEGWVRPS